MESSLSGSFSGVDFRGLVLVGRAEPVLYVTTANQSSVAMCGPPCLQSMDLSGMTLQNAAKSVSRHVNENGKHDGVTKVVTEDIQTFLSPLWSDPKQHLARRNSFFPKEGLLGLLSLQELEREGKKPGEKFWRLVKKDVCSDCLFAYGDSHKPCCFQSTRLEGVEVLTASYKGDKVLITEAEFAAFAGKRRFSDTWTPTPSLWRTFNEAQRQAQLSAAASAQATATTTDVMEEEEEAPRSAAMTTTTTTTPDSSRVRRLSFSSSAAELPATKKQAIVLPESSGSSLSFTDSSKVLLYRHKDVFQSVLMETDIVTHHLLGDPKYDPTDVAQQGPREPWTPATSLLGLFHPDGTPPLVHQRQCAELSAPLDPVDSVDQALLQGSSRYLLTAEVCKSRFDQAELNQLGRFTTASGEKVVGSRDGEMMVHLHAGMGRHAAGTIRRDQRFLALILKVFIRAGYPSAEPLHLEARNAKPLDAGNKEKLDVSHLSVLIMNFLFDLTTTAKAQYVAEFLASFLFEKDNDGGDSSDDDDDQMAGKTGRNPPLGDGVRVVRLSTFLNFLSSFQGILKMSAMLMVDALRHRVNAKVLGAIDESTRTKQSVVLDLQATFRRLDEAVGDPLGKVLAELQEAKVLHQMAGLISNVRRLTDGTAGAANVIHAVKTAQGTLVIQCPDGTRLGAMQVQQCLSSLNLALGAAFRLCFLPPAVTVEGDEADVARAEATRLEEIAELDAVLAQLLDPTCDDNDSFGISGDAICGPSLNLANVPLRFLRKMAEKVQGHNPGYFAELAEALRDEWYASGHAFSGCNLRTVELVNLERSQGGQTGSLFRGTSHFGVSTLIFAGYSQKTHKPCFGVFSFPEARILLVLLQVLGPLLVAVVEREVEAALDDYFKLKQEIHPVLRSASETATFQGQFRESCELALTHVVGSRAGLSGNFAKLLRSGGTAVLNGNNGVTIDRSILFQLDTESVDKILSSKIAQRGFQADLNAAQLRHVEEFVKVNSVSLNAEGLDEKPEAIQVAVKALQSGENQLDDLGAGYRTKGHIGGHTTQVSENTYGAQFSVGEFKISQRKLLAGTLVEGSLNMLAGRPCPGERVGDAAGAAVDRFVLNKPKGSIHAELMAAKPGLEPDADKFLLESLRTLTKFQSWIDVVQSWFAGEVLAGTSRIVFGCLPPGYGKTLGLGLPAILAVSGITILMVPYLVLKQNIIETLNAMFFHDKQCAIPFETGKAKFMPSAFAQGLWPASGKPKIVVGCPETMLGIQAFEFMSAAKSHGMLNLIAVDELHVAMLSLDYRKVMRRLNLLPRLETKLILMSGTMPEPLLNTALARLECCPSSAALFKVEDAGAAGHRRITNLVEFPNKEYVSRRDMTQYVSKHVLEVVQRKNFMPKGRHMLVYSMTVADNEAAYEMASVQFADDEDVIVVKFDSSCNSLAQRKAFLASFGEGKTVIAFCTTACAEGLDLPGIWYVIVAGGAPGGLIVIYQMACRAGRGKDVLRPLPHFVLIYSPGYVRYFGFGSEQEFLNTEQTNLEVFTLAEQEEGHKFVSNLALSVAFSPENMSKCGNRVLLAMLKEPSEGLEDYAQSGKPTF